MDKWKKIIVIVLPYVALAIILFIIFAKKSEYDKRLQQYEESVARYEATIKRLNRKIEDYEFAIHDYKDSISALEATKETLEKRLKNIKQKGEKDVAHIISSDTDWNVRFLSDYLSE